MLIGSGAKVLGPFRVGNGARVAAGAVVLDAVPDNATMAVGVPARVVSVNGVRTSCTKTLDQIHVADPVSQELCRLRFEYDKLKQQMEEMKQQMRALLPAEVNLETKDAEPALPEPNDQELSPRIAAICKDLFGERQEGEQKQSAHPVENENHPIGE